MNEKQSEILLSQVRIIMLLLAGILGILIGTLVL